MRQILVLSWKVPYDNVAHGGGRTHNLYLKCLASHPGFHVRLLTTGEKWEQPKIDWEHLGIEGTVLYPQEQGWRLIIRKFGTLNARFNPYSRYFGALIRERTIQMLKILEQWKQEGYRPDVVILEWTQLVLHIDKFKSIFPQAKYIASEHDVSFLKTEREYKRASGAAYRHMKENELCALGKCDVIMPHNEKDADLLRACAVPEHKLFVLTPYYQAQPLYPENKPSREIIFLGDMSRKENYESAIWFIRNVMPNLPEFHFRVVGGNPHQSLLEFSSPQVEIMGYVEDLSTVFSNCICMVSPLLLGAGIKIKILEAMASGVVVLTNLIGIEGIPAITGKDYLQCLTAEDYVTSIHGLWEGELDAAAIGKSASKCIKSNFNIEKCVKDYIDLIYRLGEGSG